MPESLELLDRGGIPKTFNTLPSTGQKEAAGSLPVVLAQGVSLTQRHVFIPAYDSNRFDETCIRICLANPNRRYIKIINNGGELAELWTARPRTDYPARSDLPFGEVLPAKGGGIAETDTCRTNEIWATARGATILLILEG